MHCMIILNWTVARFVGTGSILIRLSRVNTSPHLLKKLHNYFQQNIILVITKTSKLQSSHLPKCIHRSKGTREAHIGSHWFVRSFPVCVLQNRRALWENAETISKFASIRSHTSERTNVRVQNFTMENGITYAIYCNNRVAATLYTVGTWFVSGW